MPGNFFILAITTTVFGFTFAVVGCNKSDSPKKSEIAVTNSYLEAVVRDLLGKDISVLTLAEPGMCPGHFDIKPSQVQELRSSKLLIRFDFQKGLEAKLSRLSEGGLKFVQVCVAGGLCEPASYLSSCRQVAESLVEADMLTRKQANDRLAEIRGRIDRRQAWCRQQLDGFIDRPVIASVHQKAFCEWLGLKVVATFRGADVESVQQIDNAISAGQQAEVKLVIANLPEGKKVAEALAARLGARVVVFQNFPKAGNDFPYDDLLVGNVSELLKGIGR